MSSNHYLKDFPRILSYPPPRLNKCVECGTATTEKYQTKVRKIRRFGGYQDLIEHIFACPNSECPRFDQNIFPDRLTPPGSSYHFEIIHEVGRLRRQEKKTFDAIIQILKGRCVPMGKSSSCAKHLFQYYETYELGWKEHTLSTQCQGQDVILAMDGAKPENGTPTLYLISDAKQAMMYHSDWLLYSGKDQLKGLLQQVKQLDMNVVGFVSDKQRAILLAVREIFGMIPHQYCQFHWNQAAFRQLSNHDRQMNKKLKKRLRKLRDITRIQARRLSNEQKPTHSLNILNELAPFLTVVLQSKNKPPFVLKGLQNWHRTKLLLRQTLTLLADMPPRILAQTTKGLSPEQKSLVKIARTLVTSLEQVAFEAWEVHQGSQWLRALVEVQDPQTQPFEWSLEKSPAECAEQRFRGLVAAFDTAGSHFLTNLKGDILTHFEKWKKGLLACFDFPFLPRTNNNLEGYIYQLKQGQTKTSGRRNNHSTLRHQQCFQYKSRFPPAAQFRDYCEDLPKITYQTYKYHYFKNLEPILKEQRIKRDYSGMVEKAFKSISQEVAVSVLCT